jgi:hypothetical protein
MTRKIEVVPSALLLRGAALLLVVAGCGAEERMQLRTLTIAADAPATPTPPPGRLAPALSRAPAEYAGPAALWPLVTRCYFGELAAYDYILCPHSNVTQRQKGSTYNAFWGSLGVYEGWTTEEEGNGSVYAEQVYSDGTECGGTKTRRSVVRYTCSGPWGSTVLKAVSEPRTCEYDLELACPEACGTDWRVGQEGVLPPEALAALAAARAAATPATSASPSVASSASAGSGRPVPVVSPSPSPTPQPPPADAVPVTPSGPSLLPSPSPLAEAATIAKLSELVAVLNATVARLLGQVVIDVPTVVAAVLATDETTQQAAAAIVAELPEPVAAAAAEAGNGGAGTDRKWSLVTRDVAPDAAADVVVVEAAVVALEVVAEPAAVAEAAEAAVTEASAAEEEAAATKAEAAVSSGLEIAQDLQQETGGLQYGEGGTAGLAQQAVSAAIPAAVEAPPAEAPAGGHWDTEEGEGSPPSAYSLIKARKRGHKKGRL